MRIKKFQQLAQWVGFLAIAGLALYGLVTLGSGRLWAAGEESRPAAEDAPAITIPSTFNYQGFLRDGSGNPMDGTHKITLKLWKDVEATNVAALHTEVFPAVSVRDGLFNVLMGSLASLDTNIFVDNAAIFVGISVDDGAELLPRQRIHPVPWAILATKAQTASTATLAVLSAGLLADTTVTRLNANGGGTFVSASGGGDVRTGTPGGIRIAIDGNDIQAQDNGSASKLYLNDFGGDVAIGNVSTDLFVRGDLFVKNKGVVVGDESNLRIVRGTGTANATVGTIYAPGDGAGFTYKKISQGVVDVTFNTAFGGQPTVTANAMSGGSIFTHVMGLGGGTNYWPDAEGFRIIMYDTSGNGRDWPFNFIAIGPAASSVTAAGTGDPKLGETDTPASDSTGQADTPVSDSTGQ